LWVANYMYRDSRNLIVTASAPKTVELLDAAVASYLGLRKDVADQTAVLVQTDPDCPLGHCLSGYLSMHAGKSEALIDAGEAVKQAKAAGGGRPTARESLHIGALEAWINGDLVGALDRWEQVLTEHPTDILAIRLAQFVTSYLGRSQDICDSVARVLPAWQPETPAYGFLLGCQAYGFEEAGDYEQAERFGRAAVENNPEDLWASHAVAHVMEMRCQPREGIAWIQTGWQQWHNCGNFVRHLWWHSCLFHLTLQEYDRVLELYDHEVRADSTDEYLDIANAAALLWRLEQFGVGVGDRWQELAMRAQSHINDHLFVFADLHYMLAVAARSSAEVIAAFLDSCSRYARNENRTQAQVMRQVGFPIAQAIVAHRNRNYSRAVDLLLPVKDSICRIGGSHAQRDLFEQLLIDSTLRSRQLPVAKSLLWRSIAKRPNDLWAWRHLANVFEALEDRESYVLAHSEISKLLGTAATGGSGTPDI
jgi:tetratricopeptide (TPR) repeat protein